MIEGFEKRHKLHVLHAWGMTETSPLGTVSRLKPHLDAGPEPERFQAPGHAGHGGAARRRARRRRERRPRCPGTASRWASCTCAGRGWRRSYYHNPVEADKFTMDGWFRTGDVVTIDAEGYVQITDRTKDLIKSGGEWISSVDLENALMGHPAVKEAAVIGLPHPKWTERPVACVVLREGADGHAERAARVPRAALRQVLAARRLRLHGSDPAHRRRQVPQDGAARAAQGLQAGVGPPLGAPGPRRPRVGHASRGSLRHGAARTHRAPRASLPFEGSAIGCRHRRTSRAGAGEWLRGGHRGATHRARPPAWRCWGGRCAAPAPGRRTGSTASSGGSRAWPGRPATRWCSTGRRWRPWTPPGPGCCTSPPRRWSGRGGRWRCGSARSTGRCSRWSASPPWRPPRRRRGPGWRSGWAGGRSTPSARPRPCSRSWGRAPWPRPARWPGRPASAGAPCSTPSRPRGSTPSPSWGCWPA